MKYFFIKHFWNRYRTFMTYSIFFFSCPAVLPSKLACTLAFQLGFSQLDPAPGEPEEEKKKQDENDDQIVHIQNLYREKIAESSFTFAKRNLLVARLLGRPFEARLWTLVAGRTESGVQEGLCLDILCDKARYLRRQEETCGLHLNRAADRKSRAAVTARYVTGIFGVSGGGVSLYRTRRGISICQCYSK
jgi:hypothetical protein